jgi:hypothetical protein
MELYVQKTERLMLLFWPVAPQYPKDAAFAAYNHFTLATTTEIHLKNHRPR